MRIRDESDYFKLALIGHPLSHALSPVLHTAALQFAGIKGEYILFDIEPEFLTKGVNEMIASGVTGFNITIPHKQGIYRMVNNLTEEARLTGAVNTVKVETDGKLIGHNTDIIGFKLAFKEVFGKLPNKKNALIIGAGGAAKAVVVALAQLGFKTAKIKGRDPAKVRSFITEMEANLVRMPVTNTGSMTINLGEDSQENSTELDLVVNASPIGLSNDTAPEWLTDLIARLSNECLCFDLVYGKGGNAPTFTKLSLQKGLKAIDGLPMLIHQARYAFEFWTGISIPAEIMQMSLNRQQAYPHKTFPAEL